MEYLINIIDDSHIKFECSAEDRQYLLLNFDNEITNISDQKWQSKRNPYIEWNEEPFGKDGYKYKAILTTSKGKAEFLAYLMEKHLTSINHLEQCSKIAMEVA